MANKQQQSKADKKHRKLTKSPQVSCDISLLSSSPTQSSNVTSTSSSSFPLTSPKYIAYPSSLPNHDATTDENLLKNFEYSRSDLTLTDCISPSPAITTIIQQSASSCPSQILSSTSSSKRGTTDDSTIILQRYPSFSKKNIEQYRNNQSDIGATSSKIKSNEVHYRDMIKPNILFVENPVTMPTCCIKNAQSLANNNNINSGSTTSETNKNVQTSIIPTTYHQQQHYHTSTSPSSSTSSSATTILNDQLRNIRQMFQNATQHSTTSITGNNICSNNSSSKIISHHQPQQAQISKNNVTNNENTISTNPFVLSNLFKTNDKSTSTFSTTQQLSSLTALQQSSISNVNCTTMLSENSKRDEFLKATMKICLVVSPPSNKLLQLKSKSLTHLDALESHIATQTEPVSSNQTKADYLEVENSGNSIPCCISTSPTSSRSSSIKNKSSPLKSNNRPILTRSEVSSSEYFCVYYDIENGFTAEKEEFIPAVKGTTLADALWAALKRRNLSFSQITISDNNFPSSMDLGTPPYSGGVNENTDVGHLAGKILIVTEKENIKKSGHYSLQKAASFGARQRPSKLFQSASTEESTEQFDSKTQSTNLTATPTAIFTKQPKQRWSVLFGLKNPQQNQLCEILNTYAKNGVPQPCSIYCFDHIDLAPALDYLENIHSSWTDFVYYPDMTDNENKIQSAIWELVTTEVDYIHALQTVTDLFLACLEAIQSDNILNEVDQHKLFSNIRDICEANIKFWTMYLYPMVRHSINTGHPMCVDYFQPGFLTFATTFAPYKKYCAEQSTCQFYCKELHRNNALFQAYLAWCEGQKLCNRLRLADILVRPMQRLTKYSLLLSAIKKHIVDENDAEIMDAMIHSVENFVCSVNSHLTTRQENERLKGIMARIESYDVVDSNNEHLDKIAKQYSTMFDLCGPMKGCALTQGRHLFMEGDLKFKDNISKVDVHCFLLTDILLVCKTIAKKGMGTLKVIRQPFITDRLVIKVKENTLYSVYLNEFNVAVSAFTLQCPEAKSWHDAIAKAKHIYARLKQGSSWDGYNIKHGNSCEMLGVRKSPLNSSIGSKVSSLNNSHSGSVELTESKTVSIDNEKTTSLSSDEGMPMHSGAIKKVPQNSPTKFKAMSSNTLVVQPLLNLGQSLPNLNLNPSHITNNTLLVPGAASTSGHSNLLSPSHRGISYPPPSPTRATLRRGFAFSSSIKNPPLVKSRNITSQNSISLVQAQTQSVSSSLPSGAGSSGTSSSMQYTSNVGVQQQQQQLQQQTTLEQNIENSNESDV